MSKQYVCNVCPGVAGKGCVVLLTGVDSIPILCPCDATLDAKYIEMKDTVALKVFKKTLTTAFTRYK